MTTVRTHQLIGTTTLIVEAWEPFAGHSVLCSDRDGTGWLGLITRRPLPDHLVALAPASPERIAAAVDHHAACVTDALAAIEAAHPGILDRTDARVDHGRVELLDGAGASPLCEPYSVA